MKRLTGILLVLLLLAASAAIAQQDKTDYSKMPGYVDFGSLAKYMVGDQVTEINLNSNMLKMLSKLGGENDTDFKEVVGGLKLIKVNSFGVDASGEKEIQDKIQSINRSLMDKNWQRIIMVKEKGEYTNVYVLPSDDYENFLGLCVTSIDSHGKKDKNHPEATFVNIVGNINMNQLGKLGDKFKIKALEKMSKEKQEKEKTGKK